MVKGSHFEINRVILTTTATCKPSMMQLHFNHDVIVCLAFIYTYFLYWIKFEHKFIFFVLNSSYFNRVFFIPYYIYNEES